MSQGKDRHARVLRGAFSRGVSDVLRSIGAIAVFTTAYVALTIALRQLPPGYRTSGALLVLLNGFFAAACWVIPHRKRR
jgi:hypothetical protein